MLLRVLCQLSTPQELIARSQPNSVKLPIPKRMTFLQDPLKLGGRKWPKLVLPLPQPEELSDCTWKPSHPLGLLFFNKIAENSYG